MLRQIKTLVILIIVFLNAGCFERSPISISDCERIENDFKRDKCFAYLLEDMPLNNTDLRIKICDKIVDSEMRDLCFFRVARESWRFMSDDTLVGVCSNINSGTLSEFCGAIYSRPHLQVII